MSKDKTPSSSSAKADKERLALRARIARQDAKDREARAKRGMGRPK